MSSEHPYAKLTNPMDSLPLSSKTVKILEGKGIRTVVGLLSLQLDGFSELNDVDRNIITEVESVVSAYLSSVSLDDSLRALPLSSRLCNALIENGTKTVGDLLDLSPSVLKVYRGIGPISIRRIEIIKRSLKSLSSLQATSSLDLPVKQVVRNEEIASFELIPDEILSSISLSHSIESLSLSVRARNALLRGGIETVSDLLTTPEYQIKNIRNVGEKTFREIKPVRDQLLTSLYTENTLSNSTDEQIVDANEEFAHGTVFLNDGQVSASLSDSIQVLPLSNRAHNVLQFSKIQTVNDLLSITERKLKSLQGISTRTFREIQLVREQLLPLLSLDLDGLLELKSSLPDSIANKLMDFGVSRLEDLSQYTIEDLIIRAQLTYSEVQQIDEILSANDISLLTCGSEHPVIRSSDYQYLKQVGIPLDEIHISRLALPKNLKVKLQLLGIETVGVVAVQNGAILRTVLGTCSEEYNDILVKNLRLYFEWLVAQDDWDNEVANRGISPLYFIWLKETNLESIIDDLFKYISQERYRKVIRLRFGLDGDGQRTLRQIAKQFDLTCERIRQMENRAMGQLELGRGAGLIQALYTSIENEMRSHGGLMSAAQIGDHIAELVGIGEIDLDAAVILLLSLKPNPFVEITRRRQWGLEDTPRGLILPVTWELIKILQAVYAPLPQKDLIDRLTHTEWYAQLENKDRLSHEFVLACLSTDECFEETEDNQWGLTRWKKTRIDEMIMALRQLGKPSHFAKIAEVTNEMLPPSQRTSARNIYSQMNHHSHLFVWVDRGVYGLAEWGLKRVRFYAVIAEELLEQQGEPMTFEEIFPLVNAEREASPDSIKFMLLTNARFYLYPGDKFGLASWLEEPDEGEDDTDDPFLEDLKEKLFDDF
jgi:DNA-directed RNA polymerase alpha subunit/DNA-directed RNA polymerase delta subunit